MTTTAELSGYELVPDAVATYHHGGHLGREEAARLARVLTSLRYRDDMWSRMDPARSAAHVRLLTDVARAARKSDRAPALALLAFVRWQAGQYELARRAARLALRHAPRYTMARLLLDMLDAGAPRTMARLPMTPDEVARSYDELGVPR